MEETIFFSSEWIIDLRAHMQAQIEEKPFSYQVSGSASSWYSHQIHKREKPYICTVCGSEFPLISDVKKHKNIGKKPFSCQVCEGAFLKKSNLKKHENTYGK